MVCRDPWILGGMVKRKNSWRLPQRVSRSFGRMAHPKDARQGFYPGCLWCGNKNSRKSSSLNMPSTLTRRELIRKFRSLGFDGQFSGGKHQFRIPNPHRSKDIHVILFNEMLRQAGISGAVVRSDRCMLWWERNIYCQRSILSFYRQYIMNLSLRLILVSERSNFAINSIVTLVVV